MAIDASIPLGVQQPQPMQTLSNVVNTANGVVNNQRLQQQVQQGAIDLRERQGVQGVLKNIKLYQDDQGNIDWNKLTPDIMAVAPTTGSDVIKGVYGMQIAHTQAQSAVLGMDVESRKQAGNMFGSLQGQKPEAIAQTLQAAASAYPQLRQPIEFFTKTQLGPALQSGNQTQIDAALQNAQKFTLTADQRNPTMATVATDKGTQFVNTNPNASGVPFGAVGQPFTPPNQLATDTGGGTQIVNPAKGTASPIAAPNANPMSFPVGETAQTQKELQDQRTVSQQVANQAPTMRNINRSIIGEVDKGITTGQLGGLINRIKSATGFNIGEEGATDYNVLGKYLERSALQAAQGMGPHTNAGLEAQVRANGSTEYTPQAIRKIAVLNDALTTGSQLYQQGLESAVQRGGSVFAKRNFDQAWSNAMSPSGKVDGVMALRLKNAVDAGDKTDVASIIKEVGGSGSAGAKALHQKLLQINQLAGQQ